MDISLFKTISFFTIILVGISGGLLARFLSLRDRSELCFSLGNAFAGGVFLGAGLIHMLPDAQQGFENITELSDYPWFAVTCVLGFLFILFLEQVLFQHDHKEEHSSISFQQNKLFYPYVLMLVLSIHSIITGIALGTERHIVQAFVILIAVLAHKGTAAFALGISMLKAKVPNGRMLGLLLCFSLMTPIGIVLGYFLLLVSSDQSGAFLEAVFDALAAGTFLYIALVDILGEEFASGATYRKIKFLLVLAGVGLMAMVAIWT